MLYLLSWVKNLDLRNSDGFTALHLAVMSVEELGTTRPVRSLLIKGAGRHIRDNEGRKPVQLADEISDP